MIPVALPPRRTRFQTLLPERWRVSGAVCAGVLFVVAIAILPHLAPHSTTIPSGRSYEAPSGAHWFGTDDAGRDILSRVLAGSRTSAISAFVVILGGLLIGGAVGIIAAVSSKWVDSALMRITDVFLALPAPLLALAVVAALGPSLQHTLVAVSIFWWPYYARIIRAEIRSIAARPHVDAARLSGIGRARITFRHLVPGAVPTTLVAASLDIGYLILTLAALSFLGLGAPNPAPELGAMAARGLPALLDSWWIPIIPGLAIFVLAASANFAGDAIRDRVAS